MKRFVVWSCMLALAASSAPAFAQWQKLGTSLEKGIKYANPADPKLNMTRLQRALGNVSVKTGVAPASIPAHLRLGDKISVGVVKMPSKADNVTASYLYKAKNLALKAKVAGEKSTEQQLQRRIADEWTHGPGKNMGKGKMFYDNQAELARDLNEFYDGAGVTVESPSGRMLKLYMLPVNNILYKPAGYTEPIVLAAREYFVAYDVAGKTGQLVKRSPETLQMYSKLTNSGTFEEVIVLGDHVFYMPDGEPDWDLLKGEKKAEPVKKDEPEGDFEEVYSEPIEAETAPTDLYFNGAGRPATPEELEELIWLNEQAAQQMEVLDSPFGGAGRPGTPEEVYQFKKIEYQSKLAGDNGAAKLVWEKGHFPTFFSSQDQLGEQLHRFHEGNAAKVREVVANHHHVSYVYEIPVEGLYLKEENGLLYSVDPKSHVVLYNEHTGGQVVARKILEAQQLYKFVE